MSRAIMLAGFGYGHVSPNPMVGCVITDRNGNIIGEGWHRKFGTPHAEVNAVNSVKDKRSLSDATLYVTLEPCSHFGKTPPCADMIIDMGIPHVIIGTEDPFPSVSGKGIEKLRAAGITVKRGILRDECRRLNNKFITAHSLRRPYIMLKWAQDIEGSMGDTSRRIHFSSTLTRMYMHRLRAGFDAIMTGNKTIIADNPRLDVREWFGHSPRPVIFNSASQDISLYLNNRTDTIRIDPNISIEDNMRHLYSDYGITSLLVEGGKATLDSFINSGIWDCMRIEVSGQISGGNIKAPFPVGIPAYNQKIGANNIYEFINKRLDDINKQTVC